MIVGSSNLTQGGLTINREINVLLGADDDLDDLRRLFSELWESAHVLSSEKLASFAKAWTGKRGAQDPDPWIETAVGIAQPQNSSVSSKKQSRETIFQETLRGQIIEYSSAFAEVDQILDSGGVGRSESESVGPALRTNRFLNWVRLSKAPGDEWKIATTRLPQERKELIRTFGREWASLDPASTQIPAEFLEWFRTVHNVFEKKESLADLSKEGLTDGLLYLHAFYERLRFVEGGLKNLPAFFWASNQNDVEKVRRSLVYLIHGPGEFVVRLNEFLSDPDRKVAQFGKFCALELFGTLRPDRCPLMNGRTAKAMKFLGYSVSGA